MTISTPQHIKHPPTRSIVACGDNDSSTARSISALVAASCTPSGLIKSVITC